jgi:alkanesulfonate monooxygenase SsuD/methylene tetrahydromethanopterin reductase-like flavin-dependent oxidoreductase (luciferase family)
MNSLLFYTINFMPFPFIPPPEEIESSWVTLSNAHYDPRVGYRLYTEYLEQNIASERFGYDGVLVNEHHQNAYGNMPSPNLSAAHIIAKTSRIPVGIIGNALPLYVHPLRVAEEVAMLDVTSGGRIISGFVRGTGMEYFSYAQNPTFARERFWEAHDLIIKAWTEPGPFAWEGEHYYLPYVNPWPRPLQQPHPPIWLPGVGSLETIEETAKRRYTFMQVYSPRWLLTKALKMYRQLAEEKFGYEPSPHQMGAAIPTYVAETDEQAHREARPHLTWLFRNGLQHPAYFAFPPGSMSVRSYRNFVGTLIEHGIKPLHELTYEDLIEQEYVIVGSPETVIEQLERFQADSGAGVIVGAGGQWGAMPNWMVMKNMQIMAESVMPHFRGGDGKPIWARQEQLVPTTVSEHAATVKPALAPRIRLAEDVYMDPRLGHVPEAVDAAFEAGGAPVPRGR